MATRQRSAAYVRVSSKAQDLGMQQAAITRAAQARGDRILRWFSEKRSGKTLARPELDQLRRAVRDGEITRLYVYRLDRLTRSGIRDTFEIIEELRDANCDLVSIGDGFDLNGPAADVILAVMAWAAKLERQTTNERIADARLRVEAEGGAWGRPSIVPPTLRSRIFTLRRHGRSVRRIAMAVKVSRSTVSRVLLSRKDATTTTSARARKTSRHQGATRN